METGTKVHFYHDAITPDIIMSIRFSSLTTLTNDKYFIEYLDKQIKEGVAQKLAPLIQDTFIKDFDLKSIESKLIDSLVNHITLEVVKKLDYDAIAKMAVGKLAGKIINKTLEDEDDNGK